MDNVEELAGILRDAKLLKGIVVASLSLLVQDYLITFPDEVKFIWPATWNTAKLLFFATRYLALVDTSLTIAYAFNPSSSSSACDKLYLSISALYVVGLLIAEAILSLRTYAIWKGSRAIAGVLIVTNIILFVAAICYASLTLENNTFAPVPPSLDRLIPCINTSPRQGVIAIMVLLMAQELLIAVLTLWKAMTHWRGGLGNPIRQAVLRDGIMFFLVLLVMSVINVVFFAAPSLANVYDLILPLQRALHSVVTGRVILHLHIAAKQQSGHATDGFQIYEITKTSESSDGSVGASGAVIVLGQLNINASGTGSDYSNKI